ncbi:MAG TPA: D-alanyl-D-alanine carboxypeptidase/D-alanyl-D-alanine-endopeptidase [Verrucomicrobiae bacterium]
MRLHSILLVGICSVLFAQAAEKNKAAGTVEDVTQRIGEHISQGKFSAAMWGVKIVSLESGATIFETNAHKLLKPASNAKTFSGALALDVLGANYKIKTSLLAKSAPDASGTFKGDLVIYGRGDPTFSARFQDGSYTNLFGRLIEAFRRAGIRRVEGDLVGDETFFAGPRFGANWTWDDLQYYYGAEVSALSYQDNVIDLFLKPGTKAGEPCAIELKPETKFLDLANRMRTTGTNVRPSVAVMRLPGERRAYVNGTLPVNSRGVTDAVTVPDPALWFVASLREELQRVGIQVTGKVRTRSWPEHPKLAVAEWRELAFAESLPMSEIVAKMLKPSQNLYAQLLLQQVGAHSKSRAAMAEDAGLMELRAFAKRAGIDAGEVLLDEGSGLSRSALVTANALVGLHTYMARHPQGAIYREALPAPGEGTLRSRFRDLSSAKLRAKTGTLKYVNTLSGYIDTAVNEKLAFAVMLNAYDNDGSASSRDELDAIVRLLAGLREKTRK